MNSLTAYDYGFRIYNPAIGKFLSVDPLTEKYPELTPYQFASNTPIKAIDIDGLETSWRPAGQLAPSKNDYMFGSQSACQNCSVDKSLYVPKPFIYPKFEKRTREDTPEQKAASAKYIAWKEANGGYDDTYYLGKIKRENIEIVENSPTNFFPFISNLKKAGKYKLMCKYPFFQTVSFREVSFLTSSHLL